MLKRSWAGEVRNVSLLVDRRLQGLNTTGRNATNWDGNVLDEATGDCNPTGLKMRAHTNKTPHENDCPLESLTVCGDGKFSVSRMR